MAPELCPPRDHRPGCPCPGGVLAALLSAQRGAGADAGRSDPRPGALRGSSRAVTLSTTAVTDAEPTAAGDVHSVSAPRPWACPGHYCGARAYGLRVSRPPRLRWNPRGPWESQCESGRVLRTPACRAAGSGLPAAPRRPPAQFAPFFGHHRPVPLWPRYHHRHATTVPSRAAPTRTALGDRAGAAAVD